MSGHSKWHNIRLKKGKEDAARGKLFTRLAKEIIVAARNGGGSPDANSRLRLAIQKARESSMPADNIKRAIQRGVGETDAANYEELTYEGYGPHGVAVMVECMTDNKQRTVADIRAIFSRNGGNLGESGSVSWMFTQKGVLSIEPGATDEDTLLGVALDAGAEDVRTEDDGAFEILTAPADFEAVKQAVEAAKIPVANAEVTMLPTTNVQLEGKDAEQILRLMEKLEDHDDVQNVYANFDIPEEEY